MTKEMASEDVDDETLVLQIAVDQDRNALASLLKRYGPKAKGYLTKQFGDTLRDPEIDQALNDAVFNVWRFADRFDHDNYEFKSWWLIRDSGVVVSLPSSRG
jgi:DNA-directed RNA polymerase specialized sigma24 family protein